MWPTKAKSSLKSTEVNDCKRKVSFDAVTQKAAHHSVSKWPMGKIIGLEEEYTKLCKCFEMGEVGIIGVYGMGGVGKTTLLKKFYNEFLPTTQHDLVIWVEGEGTREGNVAKIHESIKLHLKIIDDFWKNTTRRAPILYSILKRKKFVLILDGVGVEIDLLNLGIPVSNEDGSKIIFSTHDEDICRWMRAREFIRVDILSPEKAFELFKDKVGEGVISSDRRIEELAKLMTDECKGLPLALTVVGRSMFKTTSTKEWERALKTLKTYPSRFPGMVEDVYRLLEFSYDRLPNEALKSCFLYCSLFPENHNIKKKELINLWIAEGYIDCDDIHEARKWGEVVISRLKRACLLEVGETPGKVKMHDVIRDMTLWIACDHESNMRFVVKDSAETSHSNKWDEVEKLSLWGKAWGRGCRIRYFFERTHCPNLLTLLMRNIPEEDMEACKLPVAIKVLDMPDNNLFNSLLSTIGSFVELEYLNFSRSSFITLPEQLKELKKLRFLLLNDITALEIPRGVLGNLSSLHAISMLRSPRQYCDDDCFLLDELESLPCLQFISISLLCYPSFVKILMSETLKQSICHLDVSCIFDKSSLQIFGASVGGMPHLEKLRIADRTNTTVEGSEAENYLKGLFKELDYVIPLRKLFISGWKIFDLDWLKFAPDLQELELYQCGLLAEIVTEEYWVASDLKRHVFCTLTTLILADLPRLKFICGRVLEFPHLEVVSVRACPNLTKLPFNRHSALNSLKCFRGEPDLVDRLEWEDEVTKNLFLEKFKPF